MLYRMKLLLLLFFSTVVATEVVLKDGAARLLSTMDQWANPCTNFYEFVCGKAQKVTGDEANPKDIEDLLDDPRVSKSIGINKVKQYWRACRAEEAKALKDKDYDKRSKKDAIARGIKRIGSWPLLEGSKWDEKTFDLTKWLIEVHKTYPSDSPQRPFFTFAASQLNINKTDPILQVDMTSADVPRLLGGDEFDQEQNRLETKESLEELLEGIPHDKKVVEKAIDELAGFNEQLAQANWIGHLDEHYVKLNGIAELQKLVPVINWDQFFQTVAPKSNYEVLKHSKFGVNRELLAAFNNVLKKTPPHVLANYLVFKYLDWGVKTTFFKSLPARSCGEVFSRPFDYAVSALYVRRYSIEESKPVVSKMLENFRSALLDEIDTWNKFPREKLEVAKLIRGMKTTFDDAAFYNDDKALDVFYDAWHTKSTDSLVELKESLAEFKNGLLYSIFRLKPGPEEAVISALRGVTFEFPFFETVNIGTSALQNFFDIHQPRTVNYGRLGVEVARTLNNIRKKIHDTSPVETGPHGFVYSLAFKAYRKSMASEGTEKPLPGLEKFGPEQIFFIASMQDFCVAQTSGDYEYRKKTVEEKIASIPEFPKVFGCKSV